MVDYMGPPDLATQYAQLQADAAKNQRRQQMAQALMQTGYTPKSGIAGILTAALGGFLGNRMANQEDGKMSEILARQFKMQNDEAQAKRAQDQAEEERKFQREIEKATKTAQAQEAAKAQYREAPDWKDPQWMQTQLALKRAEAGIAAANRQPTEYEQKLAWLQKNAPDKVAAFVTGQQGGGNVPSGYRATATGLEPIPGGPADKPKEGDPKAAAANQALSVLASMEKKLKSGGAWTGPVDQFVPGSDQQSFQAEIDSLVNPFQTLTRIPGQGSQSDAELKQLMGQFPQMGRQESVNLESIQRLRDYIGRIQQTQGGGQGAPQPQGAQATGAPAAHYIFNPKTGKLEPAQ